MISSRNFQTATFKEKENNKAMQLFNIDTKIILFVLFLFITSLIFIATTVFNDISQIRVLLLFLTAVLIIYIYITINQKNNFQSLSELYDKNVNFTKIDLNGIITDTSELFCRISGYKKEELIGKHYCFLRIPYVSAEASKLLTKLEKNKYLKQEVKHIRKDGSFYWLKEEYSPKYNKKGNLIGYRVIKQDITHAKDIEQVQKEIIFNMGSIGESRSKETGNHVKRVAEYSKILAVKYGLCEAEAEMLRQASPMHDIGKVAIPDSILNKKGALSEQEKQIMQTHAQKGYDMLRVSDRPLLKAASIVALEHHEKWDGTGYPYNKKGNQIHIYGRITAVADVFDALGSDRCYKKAWEDERIFKLFKEERGKHFDPKLVDIFFENIESFLKIRDQFKDVV
jgi:PAS domain S-box-containing protein